MARKPNITLQEELTKIQGLIETENDSLDMHILDYFNPANQKMISHIEDKAKYLTKYAYILVDLSGDNDVAIGLLNGIVDEIRDVKQELRNSLKGSLAEDLQQQPREQINRFTKISNIVLIDLINRLQRIQRVLNTAYMTMANNNN